MSVYGCVSGYQEEEFIGRCLESIRPHVDKLIYVDGAYQQFPHKVPWSNDKTILVANSLCDVVITVTKPWVDEVHKRNAYLLANPGDWYFVIDADEEFQGDLKAIDDKEWAYDIDIRRKSLPIMSILRCFKAQRGYHYFGTHNALHNGHSELLNHLKRPILSSCCLLHHTDNRPPWRVEAKGEYYRSLQDYERGFRQASHL